MVRTKQYKELRALLPSTQSPEYAKELRRHWRRLSIKYHPDKGGSNEDMQALNSARDELDIEETPAPSPEQSPVPSDAETPAPTQNSDTETLAPTQNSNDSGSDSETTSPTPKFRDHFSQKFRPRPPPHFKTPSPPHSWLPEWEADGRKSIRSDTSFPEEIKYNRKGGIGRKEQWIDPDQSKRDVYDHVHRREQDDWTQTVPPVVEQTLPPDGPIIDARDPKTYRSSKREESDNEKGHRKKRRKRKGKQQENGESVEAKMARTSAMFS